MFRPRKIDRWERERGTGGGDRENEREGEETERGGEREREGRRERGKERKRKRGESGGVRGAERDQPSSSSKVHLAVCCHF